MIVEPIRNVSSDVKITFFASFPPSLLPLIFIGVLSISPINLPGISYSYENYAQSIYIYFILICLFYVLPSYDNITQLGALFFTEIV